MKQLFLSGLLLALLGTPAAATDYNRCFGTIDADYDGEMTPAEFATAFPDGDKKQFAAADDDGNGTVSHEEWEAFKSSRGFEDTHAD